MPNPLPDQLGTVGVDAMDGGRIYVSHDHEHGITALSVAWEGGVTSVELTQAQTATVRRALEGKSQPQPCHTHGWMGRVADTNAACPHCETHD